MKRTQVLLAVLAILLAVILTTTLTLAQGPTGTDPAGAPLANAGTAFTYQGQLKNGGSAVNSTCSFQFRLYDALAAGNLIGSNPQTATAVVTNGLFAVQIDFGTNAFNGDARWLDIQVACPSGGSYTPLTPRQPLTPAPLALALPGLYTQQNATSPNVIGGYNGNVISATVVGGVIGGGGSSSWHPNRVWQSHGTVGGGFNNTASGMGATIGGGANNTASDIGATVGGGDTNKASGIAASIGGGVMNNASGFAATVPGGEFNWATQPYAFAAGFRASAGYTGTFVWADSTMADFSSTAANQFLIRANGGVGINTNAPANNGLQVARDLPGPYGYGQIEATGATNPAKRLTLGFDTTGNIGWIQASTTGVGYNNLVLNPSGQSNVMIGTTSDSGNRLTVLGDIRVGTSGTNGCVKGFGGAAIAGACSSDARLKRNITAFPNMLDKVTRLQPVYYNWRAAEYPAYHFDGSTHSYGVIAQDVEQVLPELVGTDEQGFMTVNYSEIPLLLLQALKDLRAEKDTQIAAQQKQIDALAAQGAALQEEIAQLKKGGADTDARLAALERTDQAKNVSSPSDSSPNLAVLAMGALLGIVVVRRPWQGGVR